MSNFSIMEAVTLLVHAELFLCFSNPLHLDMHYMIFNVHMWYTQGISVYCLIQRTFVVCTELDTGKIWVAINVDVITDACMPNFKL